MLNDFGLAKAALNDVQSRPGTVREKLAYLAAELDGRALEALSRFA